MKVIIDSAELHYWYWNLHGTKIDVEIEDEKYFKIISGEHKDKLVRRVDTRNGN